MPPKRTNSTAKEDFAILSKPKIRGLEYAGILSHPVTTLLTSLSISVSNISNHPGLQVFFTSFSILPIQARLLINQRQGSSMLSRFDISPVVLIETPPEITGNTGIKVLVLLTVKYIDIMHDVIRVVTGHKWPSLLCCSRGLPVLSSKLR
jgi:hypothetical protein